MVNLNGFDATTVEPTTDYDPIPAGKYLAVITDSEMKSTKSGNGEYLELTFQIIEGEFKNRNQWARLNLDNPNPKAVQIAQGELSAICRAGNGACQFAISFGTGIIGSEVVSDCFIDIHIRNIHGV